MRIIKAGNLPENRLLTGRCRHCGCEFECTVGETTISEDQRDGTSYLIDCPNTECRRVVYL